MSLPSVGITKNVFSTSQAPPSSIGILAIIAASSTGTANVPGGFARSDLAVSSYGMGPLTDFAAYTMSVSNQPTVLVKSNPTFPGSYGTISTSLGTGTSTVANSSTILPYDYYSVQVNILTGGTRGTAGITYTYSVDGGQTTSGAQALGTSTALTIPNTGVSFDIGAGTVAAGASWSVFTQRPLMNDTDVIASLTALSNTRLPWEGALIDSSVTTSTVGLIDTFLSGLEGRGIFKFVLLNTRFKNEPEPGAESEAAYAAAMTTLTQNQTSIRQCVGVDGAHVPSVITGFDLKRPTSMLLAGRAMAIQIGTDPAYVATGPLAGASISDNQGNPLDHDEDLYPNLDGLRLTSLRSFAPGGPQGTYITNANTIQPTGGSFPYLQNIRIMNRACEIAWFVLTTQLSRGVRKNPNADPVTGAVYIFEPDAGLIESLVNDALIQPMKGQVSDFRFTLSRTDNLAAVPAIVTGVLSIVALAYIKGYQVQAQFSKTLQTAV